MTKQEKGGHKMGTGYLTIQVRTANDALPVAHAQVQIQSREGGLLWKTSTDEGGSTERFPLPAPDRCHSLDPSYLKPAYALYNLSVRAEGFVTQYIHGLEILDTETTFLPVDLEPRLAEESSELAEDVDISPIGLLIPSENRQGEVPPDIRGENEAGEDPPESRLLTEVRIPDYITVHLGTPSNAAARNVRVRFPEYIKNMRYTKHRTMQRLALHGFLVLK